MKSLFRYIIFLILLNFSFAAKAESIYPIQLYAAMLPPYTNCLGDYINGDMNRLKLSAVVRDMSKHGSTMSISVLMRVKSGNTVYLETTTPVQQIINVQGAMVDIRTENLFTSYDNNAKNLVGRGSFMSNGYCLPEGAYEFVYQVFDGTNKKLPLSEPISIYCFLNQAEPPVGVTPLDGECLDSKTNQNIVFSWMDAVAIGPKYREYSVEVKEQNGAMLASQEGLLPMFGAQSEVNNFTVVTEKSYNTNTLIMQNTSSKFQEGKTYLWRVRAVPTKVNGNADENFAYKNDGYSEWMSFKYGGCGDSVVIPKADSIDMNLRVDMTTVDTSEETGSVVVHWQDIFDNTEVDKYCAYELYVYKADNESAAKTIIPIKDGETKEYTFDNLERGETYKSYIVGLTGCGTPDTIRTPHSDTVSFKLKKPESDSCMVNIDPAKCGKDDLIETLEKGSTFTANDHNVIVTITECKAGSVAGSFTGKGIVSCTIFKDKIGLNVEFEDILVNKSKELCMGTVKVITSEENNLLINLNDLTGKKRTAPKAPSQDYPYTKKVATLDELKKDVEQYKGEVVLVGDKEIYAVGNDGEIEEVGKIVENACRPSKQSLDNSAGLVVFDVDEKYNDPKWTPYIDKSPSPFSYAQIVNGYERIGSYVVPWVSMVQGEARYIKATIQGKTKTTGTGLSGMEKDIKFYCVTDSVMTELNSEYKDGAFKVKVFGGQPDRKLTIVAMMNSTGTADECAKNSKTIGETNIYTMSYRKKTIHLVPVCMDVTGEMEDPKTYADRINKVFAPLGRSYEFKFEDKFENEEVKSLIANGLNTEDGGNVFNNKTPEMKQLCRLYKHDENVKIDHRADAYVFLLDQNTNSKIKGYMPRTNSEGFVFTKGMTVEDIAETMTHELCHGLYGLEHTFSYGIDTMALPENIMSYSTQIGRTPSKYFQWYNIENPSDYHFPFTDSAEDGETSFLEGKKNQEDLLYEVLQKLRCAYASNLNNPSPIQTPFEIDMLAFLDKNEFKGVGDVIYNCTNTEVMQLYSLDKVVSSMTPTSVTKYTGSAILTDFKYKKLVFADNFYIKVPNTKINLLLDFIKNNDFSKETEQIRTNMKKLDVLGRSKALDNLYDFSYCALNGLTFEERLTLIDQVTDKFFVTQPWESIILRIIKYTYSHDESHIVDLYNELTKPERFYRIYKNMHNTNGINNADEFIKVLYQIYIDKIYKAENVTEIWYYQQSDEFDYDEYKIMIKSRVNYPLTDIIVDLDMEFLPATEYLMRVADEDGIFNFECYYKNHKEYVVPGFVILHLNLIKTYENYADFANRIFAIVSFIYGGLELKAGKYFWGLVNLIYNGSTILTGEDAITKMKKIALNNIKLQNPQNQEALENSLNILCTFLSFGINSRNIYETTINGVSLKSAAGDVANAYSEVMMFIPTEDRNTIKKIIELFRKEVAYDYVPY